MRLFRSLFVVAAVAGCATPRGQYEGTRSRTLDATGPGAAIGSDFPVRPTSDLEVVAKIDSSGDWMCVGFGSLWEPSGGKLNRIDPVEHKVVAKIDAKGNFCYASPDGKTMWVASAGGAGVTRIDQTTNTVTGNFPVAVTSGSEGSFAVTEKGVYVITNNGGTQSGTLTRLDPETGAVVADIKVKNDSHGIAAAGGSIWVTSAADSSVTQVDEASNSVKKTIKVEAGPRFIAGDESGVFTLCQGTGRVAHIDPATGEVVAHIEAKNPGFGGDVAIGEGSVWVTTFGRPVTQLDPVANKPVQTFEGNGFGDAIRAGAGYVWVSGGKLSQIKPPAAPQTSMQ